MPPISNSSSSKLTSQSRAFIEIAGIAALALIAAMIIRIFLLQLFYIPTPSMVPYLNKNDKITVNKLSYKFHDVERGDVVVFEKPKLVTQAKVKFLIKRVVGLPGETVEGRCPADQQICPVTIYIDGKKLNEPYLVKNLEWIPFDKITVPADSVFVMGDNRNNSQDGRFFGTTPKNKIIGRAFFRIWPLDNFGFL